VNGFTVYGAERMLPWIPPSRVRPDIGKWEGHVTIIETETRPATRISVRTNCPDCSGRLAVLRIIAGRASSEYWTLRCTRCGGIHLDIIKAQADLPEPA